MKTKFNSTALSPVAIRAIAKRAGVLTSLDHCDMAVLLARLEYSTRRLMAQRSSMPAEGDPKMARALQEVELSLASIDVIAPSIGKFNRP